MDSEAVEAAIKRALWLRGDLTWKLDSTQLGLYQEIFACPLLQYVIEAARKLGKSYLFCCIAVETAIRNPGGRINYCAPTVKEAAEIVLPIIREIIADCPPELMPVWRESKGHWEFPNGAIIVLFGADDERAADRGRGPGAILNIIDEAGFVPVLSYVLDSVLAPQTLRTGGRTLLGTTPPKSPGHEFCGIADAAAAQGAYSHRDIYQNGMMSRAQIDAYLTQRAASRNLTLEQFKKTSDYKREYLALRVVDKDSAVFPEFEEAEAEIVVPHTRPNYFDYYSSCDPGMDDNTGVLLGYWDFLEACLCIEAEWVGKQATTATIATEWAGLELRTFTFRRPRLRVADDPGKRLCADLSEQHQFDVSPARKDDREGAINLVRLLMQSRKLRINPACVQLRRQCRNATYVKKKSGEVGDLQRTLVDGHFDLIPALYMMARHVDRNHNPFPLQEPYDPQTHTARTAVRPVDPLVKAMVGNTPLGRRLLRRG